MESVNQEMEGKKGMEGKRAEGETRLVVYVGLKFEQEISRRAIRSKVKGQRSSRSSKQEVNRK